MKKITFSVALALIAVYAWGQSIKFEFSNIQFPSGLARIGPRAYPALDSLAEFLKNSGAKVEIAGHTDNVGSPQDNLLLSQQRVDAVRRYLISQHRLPSSRLIAKGYGDKLPLVPNLTADHRAQNRRIEITILSKIRTARLSYIQGNVFTRKQGISRWQPAIIDQVLTIQDEVVTDSLGRAEIIFDNGSRIKLSPSSDIIITKQSWNEKDDSGETELKLLMGRIFSKAAKSRNSHSIFSISTPTAVAGTRGTEFVLEYTPDKISLLSVWENEVSWRGQLANSPQLLIGSGKGSLCSYGKQPEPSVDLPAPPFPEYPAASDTFFYNPDRSRPIVFQWSKPADINVRLLVWQDVDQNEVLMDAIVSSDSFEIFPPKTDKIYWSLAAIDSIGLEGQPWPSRVLNLSRKLDSPRLEILSPNPETKIPRNRTSIKGRTELKSIVSINEQPLLVDRNGEFSQPIELAPGLNNIMITSTDRAGNVTSAALSIFSSPFKRYELQPFGAGIKLLGGEIDNSSIGFLAGMKGGYNIDERLGVGLLIGYSEIGATEVEASQTYLTTVKTGGIWGRYIFKPERNISPYVIVEAGGIRWKNQCNDVTIYESDSPFIAAGPGIRFTVHPSITLQAEGKGGFLANRFPISGPLDVNNMFVTGSVGVCYSF